MNGENTASLEKSQRIFPHLLIKVTKMKGGKAWEIGLELELLHLL